MIRNSKKKTNTNSSTLTFLVNTSPRESMLDSVFTICFAGKF